MASTIRLVLTDPVRDYLHNVLNEVLHGFRVDLETKLHTSHDSALALMDDLDEPNVNLAPDQAAFLIGASHLCEAEFEASEFATRLGFSKAEAHQIVTQLEPIAARTSMQTTRLPQLFAAWEAEHIFIQKTAGLKTTGC